MPRHERQKYRILDIQELWTYHSSALLVPRAKVVIIYNLIATYITALDAMPHLQMSGQ